MSDERPQHHHDLPVWYGAIPSLTMRSLECHLRQPPADHGRASAGLGPQLRTKRAWRTAVAAAGAPGRVKERRRGQAGEGRVGGARGAARRARAPTAGSEGFQASQDRGGTQREGGSSQPAAGEGGGEPRWSGHRAPSSGLSRGGPVWRWSSEVEKKGAAISLIFYPPKSTSDPIKVPVDVPLFHLLPFLRARSSGRLQRSEQEPPRRNATHLNCNHELRCRAQRAVLGKSTNDRTATSAQSVVRTS
ncbi:hypothetical protein F5884DRAFT_405587 [Xylogone sp. PMI_703]|nr:hypothetical protein F5884DRAFT_405587 [Xylogone sp. PMI_703]